MGPERDFKEKSLIPSDRTESSWCRGIWILWDKESNCVSLWLCMHTHPEAASLAGW